MKYIEMGIGNKWFIRTETEQKDGTEFEIKGIRGPLSIKSIYIRIWFHNRVLILDSEEGLKRMDKSRAAYKFIIGLVSL